MAIMRSTKEIANEYSEITDKISEYNRKVNELSELFTSNIKVFSENEKTDRDKLEIVKDNYNKLIEKVKEIEDFEAESFANKVENETTFKKDISDLTIDEEELKTLLESYKSSAKANYTDLPNNTVRVELMQTLSKDLTPEAPRLQRYYDLNKIVKIDRSKINDISCINFGISYNQFNMNHFDATIVPESKDDLVQTNENVMVFASDSNVITRYYRGTIIIFNNDSKPKIKAFVTIPDNEVLNDAQTIGPEFDFDFYYDPDFIYIRCYKFKPFRLNWIEDVKTFKIFDIFDRDYYADYGKVRIYSNIFFYTLENSLENTIVENTEELDLPNLVSGGHYGTNKTFTFKIDNSDLNIKPIEEGFYKYLNFNTDNSDNIIASENKKYSFYLKDKIINENFNDKDGKIKATLLRNVTNENYYEFVNFIRMNSKDDDFDTNFYINDLYMRKNGDLYIACNYGIFKKDESLNQYFVLFSGKNTLFITENPDENLLTFVKGEGFYEADGDVFDNVNPTWYNHSYNFKEFLATDEDYLDVKCWNNTVAMYSTKGFYVTSISGNFNYKVSSIDSSETMTNSAISRRLRYNECHITFKTDQRVRIYQTSTNGYVIEAMSLLPENTNVLTNSLSVNMTRGFLIKNIKTGQYSYYQALQIGYGTETKIIPLDPDATWVFDPGNGYTFYIKDNNNKLYFGNKPYDPNDDYSFGTENKISGVYISKDIISYPEDEIFKDKFLFDVNFTSPTLDRFAYISNGKLITCKLNDYFSSIISGGIIYYQGLILGISLINRLKNIKSFIKEILNKEKLQRYEATGKDLPVPYILKTFINPTEDIEIKYNEFDTIYKEVGIFNGDGLLDASINSEFDICFTGIGCLLVNKRDPTFTYWATNQESPKMFGKINRVENIRFEYFKIPCGLYKLYYKENYLPNTFMIFYGSDKKLYVLGYNTNRLIDETEDPSTFYTMPKRITEEKAKALKEYIDVQNPLALPYIVRNNIDDAYVHIPQINKYNPYIDTESDEETKKQKIKESEKIYRIGNKNLTTFNYPSSIIWSDNNTCLVECDDGASYWIRGYVDGLIPNVSYTDEFIKVQKDVYIRNIKKIVTNDFRSSLLTDYALYESNDLVIDDKYNYRDDDNKLNDYFVKQNLSLGENVPDLDVNSVKEIKLTDYNTLVLMNDGTLYIKGLTCNGINSTIDSFTKLFENVKNIWTGKDSIFITTNDFKFYSLGSNNKSQLGFESINDISEPKELTFFKGSESLYVDSVYTFKNNITFAVLSDNSIYAVGHNENYQLGFKDKTSDGIVKKFTKVKFDFNVSVEKIYNFNNKTYIVSKTADENEDMRIFVSDPNKGKFVEIDTLKNYKKKSDDIITNIFFSYEDYSLIVEYKDFDSYYLYSYFSEKYRDTKFKTVKALPVFKEEFEIVLSEDGTLYKYFMSSNQLIKINENVDNFFVTRNEKIIKLIKKDFTFAAIVLNGEYESIKSDISLNKYFNTYFSRYGITSQKPLETFTRTQFNQAVYNVLSEKFSDNYKTNGYYDYIVLNNEGNILTEDNSNYNGVNLYRELLRSLITEKYGSFDYEKYKNYGLFLHSKSVNDKEAEGIYINGTDYICLIYRKRSGSKSSTDPQDSFFSSANKHSDANINIDDYESINIDYATLVEREDKIESDNFYYMKSKNINFALTGRYNEISFYYQNTDEEMDAYLMINDEFKVEIPKTEGDEYIFFKYKYDVMSKIEFVFSNNHEDYSADTKYYGLRFKDLSFKNAYISNYGLGVPICDFTTFKNLYFDSKFKYLESYYGYKHTTTQNEVDSHYFIYSKNNKDGLKTIKDLVKTDKNLNMQVSKKTNSLFAIYNALYEIANSYGYKEVYSIMDFSVDFEILPFIPNTIDDEISVKESNSTDTINIESKLK